MTSPTLGTVQLPGDNGKLGTTYQLGPKGSELHFNLESASFATSFANPEELVVAGEKQRLLILTFTVQNPQKTESNLSWNTFKFTVVSPDDENTDYRGYVYNSQKLTHVSQNLKPAQKLKCMIAIPIYEKGPVPKLIVQKSDSPVLRYNLTDKVAKLTSVFAPNGVDMSDNGGVLATGVPTDMGPYKITIDKVEMSKTPINGYRLNDGEFFLLVTATVANNQLKPVSLSWPYFVLIADDGSGLKNKWAGYLIAAQSGDTFQTELPEGEKATVRFLFQIREPYAPKTIKFMHEPTKRFVTLEVKN